MNFFLITNLCSKQINSRNFKAFRTIEDVNGKCLQSVIAERSIVPNYI